MQQGKKTSGIGYTKTLMACPLSVVIFNLLLLYSFLSQSPSFASFVFFPRLTPYKCSLSGFSW